MTEPLRRVVYAGEWAYSDHARRKVGPGGSGVPNLALTPEVQSEAYVSIAPYPCDVVSRNV